MFEAKQRLELLPDVITCNASMSACEKRKQWQQAVGLPGSLDVFPNSVTYNASISACEKREQWQQPHQHNVHIYIYIYVYSVPMLTDARVQPSISNLPRKEVVGSLFEQRTASGTSNFSLWSASLFCILLNASLNQTLANGPINAVCSPFPGFPGLLPGYFWPQKPETDWDDKPGLPRLVIPLLFGL